MNCNHRDALIVGINHYKHQHLLPPLEAPASDAEAMAKRLKTHGDFRVRRLPEACHPIDNSLYVDQDGQVSISQLKQALVQLFKPEGKNFSETALFYFSGHGLRETLGIAQGYLATSDSNPNDEKWGVSLKWLRELLKESPIRQQIIWLDCCYSGELLNFDEANPGEQPGKSRCFMAASREFEVAYEGLGSPYSAFTKVLLDGLDPKRCPQTGVTNNSLATYIEQHLQGETQTPLFTNFGPSIQLTRLTYRRISPQVSREVSSGICPYKGLKFFDCNEEDPKYFYGREELTDQLIDKVRQSNFLAIIGASGSGKSSVLRAGLLHQLQQGRKLAGSRQWKIQIMVPGEHPVQNLAYTFLDPDLSQIDRAQQLGTAKELLAQGAKGLELLIEACDAPRVVIVIDQFEEIFTLCQDGVERQQFLSGLLGALEKAQGKLCIILAMRADFLGKCLEQEYSGLGKKIDENSVSVIPMNREQLREAITRPAQQVNLGVESALIEHMLGEIEGSPGSLPLLEYTLTRLWEKRTDNEIKLSTYVELGGIGGTLDRRATEVYRGFSAKEQPIAKQIFLSLTKLGEGTEDTRRRIQKTDLMTDKFSQSDLDAVIQKLAAEKLIVTSEETGKGDVSQRVVVIDVTHEALIRHWQQLRDWLDENRDALRQQRKIEEEAKYWREKGEDDELLWWGSRLAETQEVLREYASTVPLSKLAQRFLADSSKKELRAYLCRPQVDNLGQKELEEEFADKFFLNPEKLEQLLEDEREDPQVMLAASWLLQQWGVDVPVWTAEVAPEGKIRLCVIEPPFSVREDLGDEQSLELVEIPGGEFWMGSSGREEGGNWGEEGPLHKVKLYSFLMGRYVVTQSQWRVVASLPKVERDLESDPSTSYKGDSYPVENITWYEAVEFCERLSRFSEEKGQGYRYRLPSEAEWEYACRALRNPQSKSQNTTYHFGGKIVPALANYLETARGRTTPIGRFQVANRFGLYDMHGNVLEWCADHWHDTYEGAPQHGSAWLGDNENNYRLLRGGSFSYHAVHCRSAFRDRNDPGYRNINVGLRVVASPRT